MDQNKNISTLLIVITVLLFTFGTIALFTNRLLIKENVKEILISQDISKNIREDKELIKLLDSKKIPKESLSYIKDNDIEKYINEGLDRLYNNSNIISSDDINKIIKESIAKYEKEKNVDIYSEIEKKLDDISSNIATRLNDMDIINTFNATRTMSNSYIGFLIISLILFIVILLKSKKDGLLYDGIILTAVSILSYYIMNKISIKIIKEIGFIDITNKTLINRIKDISLNICSIIFVIGIIILLIYGVFFIKKMLREYRLKYVYKY